MKKQLKIFGALLLSLAAGMTVSEVISYSYEFAPSADSEIQARMSAPTVVAEITLRDNVVN